MPAPMMGQQMNPMLMQALLRQQQGAGGGNSLTLGNMQGGGPQLPKIQARQIAGPMPPMQPPEQPAAQPGLLGQLTSNPMAIASMMSMMGGMPGAGAAGAAGAGATGAAAGAAPFAGAGAMNSMPQMPNAMPWSNPDITAMGAPISPVTSAPLGPPGGMPGPQFGPGAMPDMGNMGPMAGGPAGLQMPQGIGGRLPSNIANSPFMQQWLNRLTPGSIVR